MKTRETMARRQRRLFEQRRHLLGDQRLQQARNETEQQWLGRKAATTRVDDWWNGEDGGDVMGLDTTCWSTSYSQLATQPDGRQPTVESGRHEPENHRADGYPWRSTRSYTVTEGSWKTLQLRKSCN
eukprot:jgi/Phyca11/106486/e_gw1.12.849.1